MAEDRYVIARGTAAVDRSFKLQIEIGERSEIYLRVGVAKIRKHGYIILDRAKKE